MWIKLLIHSSSSTVQPLKLGNGKVISFHILLGMRLLSHAGIKVNWHNWNGVSILSLSSCGGAGIVEYNHYKVMFAFSHPGTTMEILSKNHTCPNTMVVEGLGTQCTVRQYSGLNNGDDNRHQIWSMFLRYLIQFIGCIAVQAINTEMAYQKCIHKYGWVTHLFGWPINLIFNPIYVGRARINER